MNPPNEERRCTVDAIVEISRTVQAALEGWSQTTRLILIIAAITAAIVIISCVI